jgi:hypothetical protein
MAAERTSEEQLRFQLRVGRESGEQVAYAHAESLARFRGSFDVADEIRAYRLRLKGQSPDFVSNPDLLGIGGTPPRGVGRFLLSLVLAHGSDRLVRRLICTIGLVDFNAGIPFLRWDFWNSQHLAKMRAWRESRPSVQGG